MPPINNATFRYGCLALLTIQNSALILTMRYSRTLAGPKYQTATAVLLAEALKCVLSLALYIYLRPRHQQIDSHTVNIISKLGQSKEKFSSASIGFLKLTSCCQAKALISILLPSLLYTLQNNLQFVAVSNLDAATFQVLYQGKLLTTAVCSVIFLGKRLSTIQLYSILLLSAGVACASIPSANRSSRKHSIVPHPRQQSHSLGVGAVSVACLISGFAGVLTESLLKKTQCEKNDSNVTEDNSSFLWLRNFQISLAGLIFATVGVFVIDRKTILTNGFWYGYNGIVLTTIVLQATGGLVVALVITYTDNILKGFATSISVVISTALTALFCEFEFTPLFLLGIIAVLSSTHMYGMSTYSKLSSTVDSAQQQPEGKVELVQEKTKINIEMMEDALLSNNELLYV